MDNTILVYADWQGLGSPQHLGYLHCLRTKATERFDFEYAAAALENPRLQVQIDPRIWATSGRQFPSQGSDTFGVFSDASPDRWGRLLMKRRHERDKRVGAAPAHARLYESDFLLGVHDSFRIGGIRFKTDEHGPFLDDHHDRAAPPLAKLRELEEASRRIEDGQDMSEGHDWLRMLIAPGGSLGGARPKASVAGPENALWIAKFPSNNDDYDVGAWEMVVNTLANLCGLRVAEGAAARFASDHHSFMVKRFDRTQDGQRLHFASAMTMTGHTDGDDHSTGVSYLEIAEVLLRHGAAPQEDLKELWQRIVFNLLVSNTDDHLRNHGFILDPGRGWRLSAAYDMNPVPSADGLKLNISEDDNAMDLQLARSVAHYYRVKLSDADAIIEHFQSRIGRFWKKAAQRAGLSRSEIDFMAPAFSLAQ